MGKVIVPLAEGFEDIEAITIIDVLRRGGVEVVTAALGDSPEVLSAHGIVMKADTLLKSASGDEFQAIVLPGGGKGTDNLRASHELYGLLRRMKDERRLLCAICAAPVVLCDAGVVDPELQVTCYPTMVPELDRPAAPAPVVFDGDVITGQGPGSAMLFALVVLSAVAGEPVAKKVARGMLFDGF